MSDQGTDLPELDQSHGIMCPIIPHKHDGIVILCYTDVTPLGTGYYEMGSES